MINGTERDVLQRAIRSHGDVDPDYLADYYQLVPTDRLSLHRPEDLFGIAVGHRDLARQRQPAQDLVRVFTPTLARDGWAMGRSVVETVTEDRPYLVDSIRGALEGMGHRVIDLFHPIFHVTRDADGQLLEVTSGANHDNDGDADESWIHLHIPRLHEPGAAAHLEQVIHQVLQDVRTAVVDWNAMSSRMWQAASHVADRESADLLRFLSDDEFTFLGSVRYDVDGDDVHPVSESRLGIARRLLDAAELPLDTPERRRAWLDRQVIVTKGAHPSTLWPGRHNDIVAVKLLGADGSPVAEERFVGALANTVHTGSTTRIPLLRATAERVLAELEVQRDSHAGRELMQVIDSYPRLELFQAHPEQFAQTALEIRELSAHPESRLFVDVEPFQRYVTFIVYLPRDRYSTTSRLQITQLLRDAVDGESVEYQTQVSNSPLATLHFTVRIPSGRSVAAIDRDGLERQIDHIGRDWNEEFQAALVSEFGEDVGDDLARRYMGAFNQHYTDQTTARIGAWDAAHLDGLHHDPLRLTLYRPSWAPVGARRLKLYLPAVATLSDLLPMFNDLGVTVTDEYPHEVHPVGGPTQFLLDLGLQADEHHWASPGAPERLLDAVRAVRLGQVDSDPLQSLVLSAGLTVRQVVILRAVVAYLRQVGLNYSTALVQQVLHANPRTALLLVEFFELRLDPSRFTDADERAAAAAKVRSELDVLLDAVPSLDQEMILRGCCEVISVILRTNFYQLDEDGLPGPVVAFKLATRDLGLAPEPRPLREIWVHGPRVEGVHLRFGSVARGGLRWSDRREDFRTEILGLVKAQVVKNAVIVPAGAKGGFFARRAGSARADRDAWLTEGKAAYQEFITAMLSVTDNRVGATIVAPAQTLRYDNDDPYLVVAADKGTASFSDLANAIAVERGFWLGDAFASGGSQGFDHKAMGITARGAWESVKRHFRERGLDTQTQDFTCVGVGDMSGDVFGNGMLRSPHIRLVAAFDHRHIFVDPTPDAAVSFAERRRLAALGRSSWDDYDRALISTGGGVWPRDAKSIEVSDQMRQALGMTATRLSPQDLVRAVLQAPVDLFWNGGIGTYVKATDERHEQVGDRSNDAVRVDVSSLRVAVIAEGGNLGLTQRARIEAALAGIGVNSDAIDNSAGVDTSDHEVNIKIVLNHAMTSGDLTAQQRDAILVDITDEVAEHVLRTNYEQNVLVGNARTQDMQMVGPHQRLMASLEESVQMNRELEALPSDAALDERRATRGMGMSSPELSVVLAWTKIDVKQHLLETDLLEDPWFDHVLLDYFPEPLRRRFADAIQQHPLRREIVANSVANNVFNRGGVSFVFRAMEETGATKSDVVRAFITCREIFGLTEYMAAVESLDNVAPTRAQAELYLSFRRLLDRAVRRSLLQGEPSDITAGVERYRPAASALRGRVRDLLQGRLADEYEADVQQFLDWNVPEDLAHHAAGLAASYVVLDAVDLAAEHDTDVPRVLRVWFELQHRLRVGDLLDAIDGLGHADRWDAMARTSSSLDAHLVLGRLVAGVLENGGDVDEWWTRHQSAIESAMATLQSVLAVDERGLASVSVGLRALRDIQR